MFQYYVILQLASALWRAFSDSSKQGTLVQVDLQH